MAVPEASVNENDRFIFGKSDIRFAGKLFVVEAETKAAGMKQPANEYLRLCIFASYRLHVTAACQLIVHVRHESQAALVSLLLWQCSRIW